VVALASAGEAAASDGLTREERRERDAHSTSAQRADYVAGRLAAKRAACAMGWVPDVPRGAVTADAARWQRVLVRRRPGASAVVAIRTSRERWAPAPGSLSLAHRDGLGVAAVAAAGTRVGVDLERTASLPRAYARYFAHPDEVEHGPGSLAALWALKEAAWKALALGPVAPLGVLRLSFTGSREVAAVRVAGAGPHAACAALLRPWRGYVAAVLVVEAAA
jgi:phosphopantetheinyl transferase (holo-ACP synthase)